MRKLKLWWISTFKIISTNEATKMNLTFVENIYGDFINHINCRSIWKDDSGRTYRIQNLYN